MEDNALQREAEEDRVEMLISFGRRQRPGSARRIAVMAGLGLLGLMLMGAVVVSPVALNWLQLVPDADWSTLSDIGETYGGAAAMLTALTLLGVTTSLIMQTRQVRIDQQAAARSIHLELTRDEMADPVFAAAYGWKFRGKTEFDSVQAWLHVGLWVNYWYSLYEMGYFNDQQTRYAFRELFSAELGRLRWSIAGPTYRLISSRSGQRFCKIVDEEHSRAMSSPHGDGLKVTDRMTRSSTWSGPHNNLRRVSGIVAAVGLGVYAGRVLEQRWRAIRTTYGPKR